MNPALVPAAVGHPSEPLQQVSTHSRRSREVVGGGRARHGRAQPGESGLGNDRMQPQRSSGTYLGGWRIIRTLGKRVSDIEMVAIKAGAEAAARAGAKS